MSFPLQNLSWLLTMVVPPIFPLKSHNTWIALLWILYGPSCPTVIKQNLPYSCMIWGRNLLYLQSHLHLNTYTLVSLQNVWIFYLLHLNTNSEQPKIVFCISSQILQGREKNEQIKEHMHLNLKGVSKVSWRSTYWKHLVFVALIFFIYAFLQPMFLHLIYLF